MSDTVNYTAVCRTASVTLGLLIMTYRSFEVLLHLREDYVLVIPNLLSWLRVSCEEMTVSTASRQETSTPRL